MSWFKKAAPAPLDYDREAFEPVIRSSICTGERTGCLRHRVDGRLREIMLLRSEADMEEYCRLVGSRREEIPIIY